MPSFNAGTCAKLGAPPTPCGDKGLTQHGEGVKIAT